MVVKCTPECSSCSSMRTESDHPMTAHFDAAYTDILGFDSMPPAEAMLHTCPLPRRFMSGNACRATYMGAMVLMRMVRSISDTSTRSKVLLLVMMPAQLMTMSTSPQTSTVEA